jgi:hypothetical protein
MFIGYESVLVEKIQKSAGRVTNDLGMSQTGGGDVTRDYLLAP